MRIIHIAAAFLAAIMLTGCAQGGAVAETTADTAPDTTETPAAPLKSFDIDLSFSKAETSGTRVTATAEKNAINTVKSELFGDNIAWRGNGYGVWEPDTKTLNPRLVEAIKKCGVTTLRYPGGIEGDYFHWNETTGENRVPQIDPFSTSFPTYADKSGVGYYPSFGFDEFIKLCEATDTAAVVQLNAGNGTPEEAAAWVRYCLENNYNVSSFAIGNEVNMKAEKVDGIGVTKTPGEYIDFALAVYDALGDDADKVELGIIGLINSHKLCNHNDWDRTVFAALADKIDFVDCHLGYAPYFTSDTDSDEDIFRCYMASAFCIEKMIDSTLGEIDKYCGDNAEDITMQITEYGPMGTYYNSTVGSVFLASLIQVMAEEPRISSANHLPMLNHPYAALLVGYYKDKAGNEHFWDNICTYVFRWYAEQAGREVLECETKCPTFNAKNIGLMPYIANAPSADVAVYTDADGRNGSAFLINSSLDENFTFDLSLPYDEITVTSVREIWSENPKDANTWDAPNRVTPKAYSTEGQRSTGNIIATTKPLSVVRIDFDIAN